MTFSFNIVLAKPTYQPQPRFLVIISNREFSSCIVFSRLIDPPHANISFKRPEQRNY